MLKFLRNPVGKIPRQWQGEQHTDKKIAQWFQLYELWLKDTKLDGSLMGEDLCDFQQFHVDLLVQFDGLFKRCEAHFTVY